MAPHALQDPHDSTGYTPSLVNYAKLLPHVQVHGKLKVSVPIRAVLTSNDAFDNLTAEESKSPYFRHLSSEEIRDVEASVNHFQSLKLPLHAINQETFPVSESLRAKLKDVTRAVYGEHQFLIISGLDTSQYNDVENVIIHAGLSSHVGSKRGMPGREGGDNTVLNHIIAMLASPQGSTGQYHAPPNQARDIPFHTDNGDIVSLFTISASESGGSFYLADSTAVYKELKALKPKLARALVDDWTMVSPSASKDCDVRPIAFPQHESGHVLINCSRARITGTPCAPRPVSLPALTKTQRQAIDALHMLAMRRAIEIQLKPGDMIFFNNLTLMHARDAFVDNGAEGQKRHLLRLILRNEEAAYELPRQLAETWEALYEHDVEEEKFPVKKELFTWACSH